MSLPLPRSLSPSKVAAFKDCALAFRFSAIDHVPEPPTSPAVRGTLVHRALERLFWLVPAGSRSREAAMVQLQAAWAELDRDSEWLALGLGPDEAATMLEEARVLVGRYFQLEDPDSVVVLGTELTLEAKVGTLVLRGIIDRLELDQDGQLVVTDYKTGSVPSVSHEQARLAGVHFYAYLCQQVLGRRPARVQLLYLRAPVAITTVPSEQSIKGLRQRTTAVWTAVERACRLEDFRPKPSGLCEWCAFRAGCPAFGGDPRVLAALGATAAGPTRAPSGDPVPAPA